MKPLSLIALIALGCLASSCGERKSRSSAAAPGTAATPVPGYCLPASTAWAEEEYTQWMTRAELQFFQDQTPQGQYFAHVEGRNNAGLSEFRAVRKPLPTEQYSEAAVAWGLDENDAYTMELRLLRSGFVRKSMQVFVDASGKARYQLVWLKPAGTVAVAPPRTEPTPPKPIPDDTMADAGQPATEPATEPVTEPTTEPDTEPATDVPPPEDKPPVATVVAPVTPRNRTTPEPPESKKFTTYTVVKGDTVEKIARRQHTTVDAIMSANNMTKDSLQIGQKLKIPRK